MNGPRGELVRAIGRWDLTALVVNCIIGAGIFGLPAKVFALIGNYSPFAFLACGLIVFLVILCFAEAGSRFRDSGGPYLYAHAAFGPWAAFAIGWMTWLARVSSFAALANLFATYLAWFVPAADAGWSRMLVCTLVTVTLGALNLRGVHGATRVNNLLTFGKLTPLLLLIVVGVFFVDGSRFALGAVPALGDFSQAVLLLIFAFTGFESALIPAGEMSDPGRQVPFALIAGTIVVSLVYCGVQVVCIGSLADPGASSRPLADAAQAFAGAAGAALISAGALVSIGGTLNAAMLAAPRVLFAMCERGQMPMALGSVHARFRTPHVAIIVTALAMLVAAVSGGFIVLVLISTIARLLVYASTCAAVVVLRRQPDAGAAPFTIPGGAFVPGLALVLCGWLLLHSTREEAVVVAVALAAGAIPYALWRLWTGRRAIG